MRKFLFAAAAATALAASAGLSQAAMTGSSVGTAADNLNVVENAQFIFEGRRHCWYARAWNGAGWYRCGYNNRRGHGYGGAEGWNGWNRR